MRTSDDGRAAACETTGGFYRCAGFERALRRTPRSTASKPRWAAARSRPASPFELADLGRGRPEAQHAAPGPAGRGRRRCASSSAAYGPLRSVYSVGERRRQAAQAGQHVPPIEQRRAPRRSRSAASAARGCACSLRPRRWAPESVRSATHRGTCGRRTSTGGPAITGIVAPARMRREQARRRSRNAAQRRARGRRDVGRHHRQRRRGARARGRCRAACGAVATSSMQERQIHDGPARAAAGEVDEVPVVDVLGVDRRAERWPGRPGSRRR